MNKLLRYITLILILLTVYSCKKDTKTTIEDYASDYYPLTPGYFITYKVTEITYDDFFNPVKIDTAVYQLRVVVDSIYNEDSGTVAAIINRFKKSSDTSTWNISDVWWVRKTNKNIEVIEENINFLKLVLPVRLGKKWNGNVKNTLQEELYEITETSSNSLIYGQKYERVVKVLQKQRLNLIEDFYAEEKYAEGIGLIYKINRELNTTVEGEIESGSIVEYEITKYGNL